MHSTYKQKHNEKSRLKLLGFCKDENKKIFLRYYSCFYKNWDLLLVLFSLFAKKIPDSTYNRNSTYIFFNPGIKIVLFLKQSHLELEKIAKENPTDMWAKLKKLNNPPSSRAALEIVRSDNTISHDIKEILERWLTDISKLFSQNSDNLI